MNNFNLLIREHHTNPIWEKVYKWFTSSQQKGQDNEVQEKNEELSQIGGV